jgi:hypothetical protein
MDKESVAACVNSLLEAPGDPAIFPGNLAGYSARQAATELLASWVDALQDGSKDNLLADIDHVIVHLRHFRQRATTWLPVANQAGLARPAREHQATDGISSGEAMVSVREAWEAAGGNPGITPTRAELFEALRQLDQVCDDVDARRAGVERVSRGF